MFKDRIPRCFLDLVSSIRSCCVINVPRKGLINSFHTRRSSRRNSPFKNSQPPLKSAPSFITVLPTGNPHEVHHNHPERRRIGYQGTSPFRCAPFLGPRNFTQKLETTGLFADRAICKIHRPVGSAPAAPAWLLSSAYRPLRRLLVLSIRNRPLAR